jgi:ribosome-binding factor A
MPKLTFYIDDTLEYAEKIEKLFKEIKDAPPIVTPGGKAEK